MWFKKKSVLQAEHHYDTEKSADGSTDVRTTYKYYENTNSIRSGLPSAADAGNYFYLPALGYYDRGQLIDVGSVGVYWSSNTSTLMWNYAYCLSFTDSRVNVGNADRYRGYRVEAFQ